ncbi:MAG: CoA transferase [Chloroflexi bacterium]|nr:CoA transferase [Chloroflexota bacterium]
MEKALTGTRVLDFTRMAAGPVCTMIMAELGADIIKIELPQGGDAMRTTPPLTEGLESYLFLTCNRGKRSITLDPRTEEGNRIARQLASKCDVLVENFTPGIMDKMGLGHETIVAENPGLIYVSVSGFGNTGPYRSYAAYDTIVQAMGGLISVNGRPDSPPTKVGPAVADICGGVFAALATLAALQYKNRTGRGQYVDISMQDVVWMLTATQFLPFYTMTGQEPPRPGNRQLEITPFNIYPAKDGHIVIGIVTVDQWQRFIKVIGREDLKEVKEYAMQANRIKHVDEIDALVGKWTRVRTVDEMLKLFRDADLPCAPVPTFRQVANDPQLTSRNMQVEIEQLVSGKVKVMGSVFKMSQTPGDPAQPAPFLGQHTHEVYAELLGFSDDRITELQEKRVI